MLPAAKRLYLLIGNLLLFLSLPLTIWSQESLDFKDWQAKIMEMEALSPDSAIQQLDAISATVEEKYPSLFSLAQCVLARQYFKLGQAEKGYPVLRQHLPLLGDATDDWERARFNYLFYYYRLRQNPDSLDVEALKDFRERLISIETTDTIRQNQMYWNLGYDMVNYESFYGRTSEALNHIYELIELTEVDSANFDRYRFTATYFGGSTYFHFNDFEKSRKFFELTIEAADRIGNVDALDNKARSLHFLGILDRKEGDTLSWAKHLDQSIEILEEIESENIIPALLDLAEYHIIAGKLDEGEHYLNRANQDLAKYEVTTPYLIGASYLINGMFEAAKGNHESALAWTQKAYQADKDATTRLMVLPKIQIYAARLGQYQLAYESAQEYLELYKTGMSEKQQSQTADIENKYAMAQKEREAAHLIETQVLQSQRLNLQQTLLMLALFVLLVMGGLSFYLYRLGERLKGANRLLRAQKLELSEAKETAIAASKAKAQFLSVMSHEIRTPMNGVMGMTDLLASTKLNEEQGGFVKTISNSADSLLMIINEILDFSKIESGNLEIEQIAFSLREHTDEVMDLFAAQAAEKGLALLHYLEPNIPDRIVGDPLRLKQILSNLVSNAIKFTPSGEILLELKLKGTKVDSDDLQIEFRVKDTGVGIAKAKQSRLFKAFSQADSSTTRQYGGTGLGLAISAQLCQLMGGEIWVESKEGEGSTFAFTIRSQKAIEANQGSKVPPISLKGIKILVVESNASNLQILDKQLSNRDAQTILCDSTSQGLAVLEQKPKIDLIIADALTFSQAVQAKFGKQGYPFILLHSVLDLPPAQNSISATLSKPIKEAQLIQTVFNLINGKTVKTNKQARHILNQTLADDFPLSILVAEDNKVNQKLVLRMLTKLGYQVDLAQNGAEAVNMSLQKPYDLVMMDVQMPEMDGISATRRILRDMHQTPVIIAMTANALKEDLDLCFEAGMTDHLSKPFRSPDLVGILKKYGKSI